MRCWRDVYTGSVDTIYTRNLAVTVLGIVCQYLSILETVKHFLEVSQMLFGHFLGKSRSYDMYV